MSEHIVKSYDDDLSTLKQQIVQMVGLCLKQINNVYSAIGTHDKELSGKILESDKKLNELDKNITLLSLNIMSLRNPVAFDLRFVFAASHISRNLERIGDNTINIAKYIQQTDDSSKSIDAKIMQIVHHASEMLHGCLQALENNDSHLAKKIINKDLLIDELHYEVSQLTLAKMQDQPSRIHYLHSYLLIGRYLERIGDHIVNVCKYLLFIESNQLVFDDNDPN